jgi:hypothetical protein
MKDCLVTISERKFPEIRSQTENVSQPISSATFMTLKIIMSSK